MVYTPIYRLIVKIDKNSFNSEKNFHGVALRKNHLYTEKHQSRHQAPQLYTTVSLNSTK